MQSHFTQEKTMGKLNNALGFREAAGEGNGSFVSDAQVCV